MIIPDVNVVVHAWWADSGEHERARRWLEDAVSSSDVVGISEVVLSGAVRVLTHPRVTGGTFSSREVLRRADCYHAALALENDAVWISLDRSFANLPGVRWQRPW